MINFYSSLDCFSNCNWREFIQNEMPINSTDHFIF